MLRSPVCALFASLSGAAVFLAPTSVGLSQPQLLMRFHFDINLQYCFKASTTLAAERCGGGALELGTGVGMITLSDYLDVFSLTGNISCVSFGRIYILVT